MQNYLVHMQIALYEDVSAPGTYKPDEHDSLANYPYILPYILWVTITAKYSVTA